MNEMLMPPDQAQRQFEPHRMDWARRYVQSTEWLAGGFAFFLTYAALSLGKANRSRITKFTLSLIALIGVILALAYIRRRVAMSLLENAQVLESDRAVGLVSDRDFAINHPPHSSVGMFLANQ